MLSLPLRMLIVSAVLALVIDRVYVPSNSASLGVYFLTVFAIQSAAFILSIKTVRGGRSRFLLRTFFVSIFTSGFISLVLVPFHDPGFESVFVTVTAIEFGGFLAAEAMVRKVRL